MKYVLKRDRLDFLTEWIEAHRVDGELVNCHYRELKKEDKNKIKQALLEDQGYICCYTGHVIDLEDSHIEHIKPQSTSTHLETVDYYNMLAAYPQSPLKGEPGCKYGAQARGADILLVTPLMEDCERRFRFLKSGHIKATDDSDRDAVQTIESLRLDHPELVDFRKGVIDETFAIFEVKGISLSELVAVIEKLDSTIYSRDSDGRLSKACFVIKGLTSDLLKRVRKTLLGDDE